MIPGFWTPDRPELPPFWRPGQDDLWWPGSEKPSPDFWIPGREQPEIEIPDRSLYLAAALVNATTHTGSSGGTFACTTSGTVGNLIVVACGNADGRGLSSVTDDRSGGTNTYAVDKSQTASGCGAGIASTSAKPGAITSVTVTLSGSSSNLHVDVLEFSGIQTTSYVGLSSNGSGTGTAIGVTSFTPTAANLVVGACGLNANRTIGKTGAYSWGSTDNGGSIYAQSQYILSHPGTGDIVAFVAGSSAIWSAVAVEYVVVAAAGQPTMRRFGGVRYATRVIGAEGVGLY